MTQRFRRLRSPAVGQTPLRTAPCQPENGALVIRRRGPESTHAGFSVRCISTTEGGRTQPSHGHTGTRAPGRHTGTRPSHGHTAVTRVSCCHTGTRPSHGHPGTRAHGHTAITRAHGRHTGTRPSHGHTAITRAHGLPMSPLCSVAPARPPSLPRPAGS